MCGASPFNGSRLLPSFASLSVFRFELAEDSVMAGKRKSAGGGADAKKSAKAPRATESQIEANPHIPKCVAWLLSCNCNCGSDVVLFFLSVFQAS